MKDIPSYLFKLVDDFETATTNFDCLIEADCPFDKYQLAEFEMKQKALAIAFALSCEFTGLNKND